MSSRTRRALGALGLAACIAAGSLAAPGPSHITHLASAGTLSAAVVGPRTLERAELADVARSDAAAAAVAGFLRERAAAVERSRQAASRSRRVALPAQQPAPPRRVAPAPPSVQAPIDGCIGHKMSRDAAKACWWVLLARFTDWSVSKAFSVLYCESTGSSVASNGSHWGLFQLDTGPYWDPWTNIRIAHDSYYAGRGHDWGAWTCA